LSDLDLKKAVIEIENGLVDANLGGNLYKKRIGKQGQGKRGAYRVLFLMKVADKVIFAHGFSKSEQDNITKQQLEGFKIMAEAFLSLTDEQIKVLIDNQNLVEINNE
jgi:hypothetical protein